MSRGLRALKRIEEFLKVNTPHWKQDVGYIEKDLQALEIIKRTAMKLVSLEDSESGICVNGRYAIYDNELYQSIDITKEEYDLLKEVL